MEDLKLTFVNVGYGEAMLLECPSSDAAGGVFTMLIDGGSGEPEEYADRSGGRVPVWEYLESRGLDHLDCMVTTHIHEDHACGLAAAARRLPPAELWQVFSPELPERLRPLDPALGESPSQGKFLRAINDYQTLCRLTRESGGTLRTVRAGECRELCPGLRCRVLAPGIARAEELEERLAALCDPQIPADFGERLARLDREMNNYSMILRLEYQGVRVLLPGDTNCLGYGAISPEELRAEIFKVGHHGQRDGVSPELLQAVCPEAVVCCASSDRRYESAHPQCLEAVAQAGGEMYFSDCPQTACGVLPVHRVLEFQIGGGRWTARYGME